jgi:hypothetical protein
MHVHARLSAPSFPSSPRYGLSHLPRAMIQATEMRSASGTAVTTDRYPNCGTIVGIRANQPLVFAQGCFSRSASASRGSPVCHLNRLNEPVRCCVPLLEQQSIPLQLGSGRGRNNVNWLYLRCYPRDHSSRDFCANQSRALHAGSRTARTALDGCWPMPVRTAALQLN